MNKYARIVVALLGLTLLSSCSREQSDISFKFNKLGDIVSIRSNVPLNSRSICEIEHDISKVKSLSFSYSSIDGAGIDWLAKIKAIETLEINYSKIDLYELFTKLDTSNLKRLDLTGSSVTDKIMQKLATKALTIKELDISESKDLSASDFSFLKSFESLERLTFNNVDISLDACRSIGKHQRIKELSLASSGIDNAKFSGLGAAKGHSNLLSIDLTANNITELDPNFFNHFQKLTQLMIGFNNLSDDSIRQAAPHLKGLKFLVVSGNKISTKSLDSLKNIPNLRIEARHMK